MARRGDSWALLPFERFLGLNLRDQPEGLRPGEALNLLNVRGNAVGGVRSRPGWQVFEAASLAQTVAFLAPFYSSGGTRRLIAAGATALYALNDAGGLVHTAAGGAIPTALMSGAARFGGPNSERLYLGNGVDTLRRYDTTSGFTAPTCTVKNLTAGTQSTGQAMPKGACVAAWPGEERLVVAGFGSGGADGPGGLASGPEYAWISEPGDPEVFAQTGFVRLNPGDGDQVRGACAWRELVFIFKESKFYAFTNVTTDARGVATFNRRVIDVGIGSVSRTGVAVGRDGVYFVGRDGIYRTRGGDPELITPLLVPLWANVTPPFYDGGLIDNAQLANVSLAWQEETLYLSFKTPDGSYRMLVVDLLTGGQAYIWNIAAAHLASFRAGARAELHFARSSIAGSGYIGAVREALAVDGVSFAGSGGSPFKTLWHGGFHTPAGERVVRVARMAVWGTGRFSVGLARDYRAVGAMTQIDLADGVDTWGNGAGADTWGGGVSADTWGGGQGLGRRLVSRAYLGSRFAIVLAQSPGSVAEAIPWSVVRVVEHVAGRQPRHAANIAADG